MNTLSDIKPLAAQLLQRGWLLSTAESCTGGMIAAHCTDLAGSSQWFERGFVSYSNDAKHEMLGVSTALIDKQGAVSEAVAQAMVLGALNRSKAQVALAVTGIAGPGGGSKSKPVGTVCFAWSKGDHTHTERLVFGGDRQAVRQQTVAHALKGLMRFLEAA